MHISDSFVVPVDIDSAWAALLDVQRVAPCMPGATLQTFDGDAFTGTVAVKLGALSMRYQGSGRFLERDITARKVAFEASGRESRGAGAAAATVVATLREEGDQTRVDVDTDLNVSGRAAQFGRGVMNDVAGRLLGQFANALAEQLASGPTPAGGTDPIESTSAGRPPVGSSSVAPSPAPTVSALSTAGRVEREAEPIDLVDIGRHVIVKRATPIALLVAGLIVVGLLRRRARRNG
jgi:carbon monoxide dehydrogenase subunit G